MNNKIFIDRYGVFEFREMCKYLPEQLSYAKITKKICRYKINNRNKNVIFYNREKGNITLEFSTIFNIGIDNLQKYIDNIIMGKEINYNNEKRFR